MKDAMPMTVGNESAPNLRGRCFAGGGGVKELLVHLLLGLVGGFLGALGYVIAERLSR